MSIKHMIADDLLRHSMTAMEIAKRYHTSKGVTRIGEIRRERKDITVLDCWVKRGNKKFKKYWAVAKAKRAK